MTVVDDHDSPRPPKHYNVWLQFQKKLDQNFREKENFHLLNKVSFNS